MIEIIIKISEEKFVLEANGHSLMDRKGKDLLCCAVSILIQNWYFSEKDILHKEVELVKENNKTIYILKDYNKEDKLLFQSLCYGLINLERQYKNNIKLEVEGINGT